MIIGGSGDGYHPFGMVIEERSLSSSTYVYGFNGQEKDDAVSGIDGGHLSFRYRLHDSRLGRFLSVDPLSADYPWNSTYAFAENTVIWAMELEGLEAYFTNDGSYLGSSEETPGSRTISLDESDDAIPKSEQIANLKEMVARSNSSDQNLREVANANLLAVSGMDLPSGFDGSNLNHSTPTLSPKSTNGWEKVKESNWLGSFAYGIADDFYLGVTGFSNPTATHLDGSLAQGSDRIQAFANMSLEFVPIGGGLNYAHKTYRRATFFNGAKYSSKVSRQMSNAKDLRHAFPMNVDGYARRYGKWTKEIGGDSKSYEWLRLEGEYRGQSGIFEYTKDANGIINHR